MEPHGLDVCSPFHPDAPFLVFSILNTQGVVSTIRGLRDEKLEEGSCLCSRFSRRQGGRHR